MKKIILSILLSAALFATAFAQTPTLMGMSGNGGTDNNGVVYYYPLGANLIHTAYDFTVDTAGAEPFFGRLCLANNGKFYGMTYTGGTYNMGVLFEYDPTKGTYTRKVDFNGSSNGKYPSNSLMQASNGKLYGVTFNGGTADKGVLFEYDIATGILSKKIDFSTTTGISPTGRLLQAKNGKLYGTATEGGKKNKGTLYEYDINTTSLIKLLDFDAKLNGSGPIGDLIQASNEKIYGLTYEGGENAKGVLFEYDITSKTFTKKLDFDGTSTGSYPAGGLLEASNQKLYGATINGGSKDEGILFEYNTASAAFNKLLDFDGDDLGGRPRGGLTQGLNGNLYGLTERPMRGQLFEYNINTGIVDGHVTFNETNTFPSGTLAMANNGQLYGCTMLGGKNRTGTFFRYTPNTNTFQQLFSFGGSINGTMPNAGLLKESDELVYGTTTAGGTYGDGTLFQFNPKTNAYTKLIDFDGSAKGSKPSGKLIKASNGKYYGLTSRGGKIDAGVLFEYDPATNLFNKKYDFEGQGKGIFPVGSLVQSTNGKLYGCTEQDGLGGYGSIFEYDITTNTFNKRMEFNGSKGSSCLGSLVEVNNLLYGITQFGGPNNKGVLFEYNPNTNSYINRVDFNESGNGYYPKGALLKSKNNLLFGTTTLGGDYDGGIIFEYDPAINDFSKKYDFDKINGGTPTGTLFQASNGNLYGSTIKGGATDEGVLFECKPSNGFYTKLASFEGLNGRSAYGELIELSLPITDIRSTPQDTYNMQLYPNPSKGATTLTYSISKESLVNINIYSALGSLVQTLVPNTQHAIGNYSLNLTQPLPSGNYFIAIQTSEGISSLAYTVIAE